MENRSVSAIIEFYKPCCKSAFLSQNNIWVLTFELTNLEDLLLDESVKLKQCFVVLLAISAYEQTTE
jgi:hypothetical protein